MRHHTVARSLTAALAGLWLIGSESALGETQVGGLGSDITTSGRVEVDGLAVQRNSNSSKYEEYRHIPQDEPLLDQLEIELQNDRQNYYASFRAEDAAQDDQRYVLRIGRYGVFEIGMMWDELPQVLSNSARTLFEHSGSGTFTLSDAIQQRLQDDPSLAVQVFSEARAIHLGVKHDTGSVSFRYTPSPGWDFRAGYSIRNEDGKRPIGTGFFFGNAQPIETLNPIDYTTHQIDASAQYSQELWSLRLAYSGSIFKNGIDALVWDNPFRATDSVSASSRGRLDLPPDNQAHTISLDGVLRLPARTQIVGLLSYGWRLQNDDFLPFTINSAIQQPTLPAASLEGEIKPFVAHLRVDSHPLPSLGVEAGYRLFDLDNDSRSLEFPGYIAADTTPEGPRRNLPYAYTLQRANARAQYDVATATKLGLEYRWENWHRRFRELDQSNEHTVGPSLDFVPRRWLALRTSYSHSWRDASGYNGAAPDVGYEPGQGAEQLPQLRKFDEAARERDEVAVLGTFTPRSTLSVVASVRVANDDYLHSTFGLRRDVYWSPGIDVAYGPFPFLLLSASYSYEVYDYRQNSRERGIVVGADGSETIVDNPALDWTASGTDIVHTIGGGVDLTLVPKKLTLNVDYSISDGLGRMRASGPNPRASDYPDLRSRLQQLSAVFRYTVGKGVYVKAGYRFERYDETDFATTAIVGGDDIQPFMGNVDPGSARAVYLGALVPNYTAHIAIAALGFEW